MSDAKFQIGENVLLVEEERHIYRYPTPTTIIKNTDISECSPASITNRHQISDGSWMYELVAAPKQRWLTESELRAGVVPEGAEGPNRRVTAPEDLIRKLSPDLPKTK
jgi:hypothetical protein